MDPLLPVVGNEADMVAPTVTEREKTGGVVKNDRVIIAEQDRLEGPRSGPVVLSGNLGIFGSDAFQQFRN